MRCWKSSTRASAQGEDIGPGDVDGLLRHASDDAAPADGLAQIRTRRRIVSARSPNQSAYIQALERVDLVFGLGPAGTGKTYLAVAFAAQCLERGLVDRIVLSRPAVEAGERLGFLPGDMREKVDPYLRPLYDALYDVLPQTKVERDLETGVIEIAPLAFMRGRTLAHAFVILDEAQNTTQHADEDVPDPYRRRLEDGGDRRSRARSTCRRASARASRRRWGCSRACAASRRSASPPATWCAATSWPASSKPTTGPARRRLP